MAWAACARDTVHARAGPGWIDGKVGTKIEGEGECVHVCLSRVLILHFFCCSLRCECEMDREGKRRTKARCGKYLL
jgi:hypothetical protein